MSGKYLSKLYKCATFYVVNRNVRPKIIQTQNIVNYLITFANILDSHCEIWMTPENGKEVNDQLWNHTKHGTLCTLPYTLYHKQAHLFWWDSFCWTYVITGFYKVASVKCGTQITDCCFIHSLYLSMAKGKSNYWWKQPTGLGTAFLSHVQWITKYCLAMV